MLENSKRFTRPTTHLTDKNISIMWKVVNCQAIGPVKSKQVVKKSETGLWAVLVYWDDLIAVKL